MDLSAISKNERLCMMRKRQAYFAAVAEEYYAFDDFINTQQMWLAIMGIQLIQCETFLKIYIQLDFTEYEQYHVIKTLKGNLTVSDIIMWQDDYCCNSYLNISTGSRANEEQIFNCY